LNIPNSKLTIIRQIVVREPNSVGIKNALS